MKIDKDFIFTINVSSEGYASKKDASACLTVKGAQAIGRKKMCFFEQQLSVDDFIARAQEGHSFCSLFRLDPDTKYWYKTRNGRNFCAYPYYRRDTKTATKGAFKLDFKRDDFFFATQVIFIDIDYTRFSSIPEYIECLKYKPTCVYPSYSDNRNKGGVISRRFHLVYVFDRLLNSDDFYSLSTILSDQIEEDTDEELEDDCGKKMSQYFNGCCGSMECYVTYNIYNEFDMYDVYTTTLYPEIGEGETLNNEDDTTTLNHRIENPTTFVDPHTTTLNHRIENPTTFDFDMRLLNDWDILDQDEFIRQKDWVTYQTQTRYYYRTEGEDWTKGYQFADDSYFRMFWITHTLQDGQKRRKSLFERMCLRKLINPDITPMELTVNTMIDIIRFYDNGDRVLDSDFIVRNVTTALSMTTEEIEQRYKGEIEYLRSTTRPKKGIIYKSKKHMKEFTNTLLDENYDKAKSVEDNIVALFELCNFIVKKDTVYKWLKNRNIKTDPKKLTEEELILLTDYSLSANKNLKYIKSLGYKLDNKRYNEFYKKNKTTTLNHRIENPTTTDDSQNTTLNHKIENPTTFVDSQTTTLNHEIENDTMSIEDRLFELCSEISGETLPEYNFEKIFSEKQEDSNLRQIACVMKERKEECNDDGKSVEESMNDQFDDYQKELQIRSLHLKPFFKFSQNTDSDRLLALLKE